MIWAILIKLCIVYGLSVLEIITIKVTWLEFYNNRDWTKKKIDPDRRIWKITAITKGTNIDDIKLSVALTRHKGILETFKLK